MGPFQVIVNSTEEVSSAMYLEGSSTPGKVVKDLGSLFLITIRDAFDEIQNALDQDVGSMSPTTRLEAIQVLCSPTGA